MGRGSTVWRAAPGLYYRMVEEVIRRSVAAHGPPLQTDFDEKLVGAKLVLTAFLSCAHRSRWLFVGARPPAAATWRDRSCHPVSGLQCTVL